MKKPTDIKDRHLEIIGGSKIDITSAVKDGIKNDLIVNSASLLKDIKTEVSKLCSSIGSYLINVPEILLKREQTAIVPSLESSPQRLLQEQQMKISQYMEILPVTDPVNNMIVPHLKYSILERFANFQSILTHYKNKVRGKKIGGSTKRRQYLTTAYFFTRMKRIRSYDRCIDSHFSTASHKEVIMLKRYP